MANTDYSDKPAAIMDAAADVATYTALWLLRGDGPDAQARKAASSAIDAVDACIAELHALRQRLISDVRESDDAAMARTAKLLTEARTEAGS